MRVMAGFRCHLAFTLVELLTVIAVISVLAAIIFPAFGKYIDMGHQRQCTSNLRQIGLAFRMYMQDYDEARPEQLGSLVPSYVSSPQLLECPADRTGNSAYLTWGKRSGQLPWRYPTSYYYFAPLYTSEIWNFLEARGPSSGYIVDVNHGEYSLEIPTDGAPNRWGIIQRLNMDGSVVTRHILYPERTFFDMWTLINYNPGEPVPAMPSR